MELWPVFLWRYMYEDSPQRFGIGDEISWDVILIDGEAEGWPSEVLVDTTVSIEDPPRGAPGGALARTPELVVCWRGLSPIGSKFRIRAGLDADWFNPPFHTTVTGIVRRLQIVAAHTPKDETRRWPAANSDKWYLSDLREAPNSLRRADPEMPIAIGLLVGLEVLSSEVQAFNAA